MRDAMSVLIRPVVSEKSYGLMDRSVYVFIVDPRATKIEVRHAVEQAFGVRVTNVNTLNRKGKATRNRRTNVKGKRPDTKRAIVTLHPDDSIDLFDADRDIAMPLRSRKPTSPGRRFQTVSDFSEITRDRPEKSLLAPNPQSGGRNNHGRKTSRHRGGGHKQQYRVVDFRRNKDGIPAKVATIEYDPNRNARIALLHYADGEKRYILAPAGVKVGDKLQSGQGADIRPGNALPLRYIPVGSTIHNVELRPGGGGKMARGAGMSVQLVAKEGAFATLRLPSTEMRRVSIDCRGTLGVVGNAEAELVKVGKAGRNRWKGKRPQTRGVAMNPVDHPLGGGEGKSSGGRHPVSPWGKPEGRTRARNKKSNSMIVRRRRTRGARR